jgi:hypothetical protein
MISNTKIYFVGYIKDDTFWCNYETDDKEKAIERASNRVEGDTVEWCVYERVVTHEKIASFLP